MAGTCVFCGDKPYLCLYCRKEREKKLASLSPGSTFVATDHYWEDWEDAEVNDTLKPYYSLIFYFPRVHKALARQLVLPPNSLSISQSPPAL